MRKGFAAKVVAATGNGSRDDLPCHLQDVLLGNKEGTTQSSRDYAGSVGETSCSGRQKQQREKKMTNHTPVQSGHGGTKLNANVSANIFQSGDTPWAKYCSGENGN